MNALMRSLLILLCVASTYSENALSTVIAEKSFKVPGNTIVLISVEFTLDNKVILETFPLIFVNARDPDKVFTAKIKGPASRTNDLHWIKQISWDGDGKEFEKWTRTTIPDGLAPDLAEYYLARGFVGPDESFDLPSVTGDQNGNGIADVTDTPIFSLIEDLDLFSTVADEALFEIDSLLATDTSGHIASLPGIAFYTDSAHTLPYANSQMLVVGVDKAYFIAAPATLSLLGLGLVCIGFYRRKARNTRT
ncbi:MAG: hypothetical protein V7752_02425 [Halopseudomonas sp.]